MRQKFLIPVSTTISIINQILIHFIRGNWINNYQYKFTKINTESKAPLQAVLLLIGIFGKKKSVNENNSGTTYKKTLCTRLG